MRFLNSLLFICACGLTGCGPLDPRVFTTRDAWFAPAPPDSQFFEPPVHNVPFTSVTDPSRADVQRRLSEVSWFEIPQAEVAPIAGHEFRQPGCRYFLIRAIRLDSGNGGYTVYERNGDLLVLFGCMGNHPVPMARAALIVALAEPPRSVYMGVDMAE
jgi:hypothetical protein